MSTKVQYGSVVLENVSTRRWDETVVFDESGTDQIGVRYNLTFDAIVHQQVVPVTSAHLYVDDGSVYSTPPQRLVGIKKQLTTQRQELKVWFGDDLVLNAKPITGQLGTVDGRTDIENGPRPESFEIFHIASDRVFRIRWSVSVVLRGCDITYSDGDTRFAINNRWSVREAMDENHRITRTISGTLRLAGAATETNSMLPQAFRSLCFPGLEDGFRRTSVSFQAEKTGLALSYEITDVQGRYAPPFPATDMQATHTTSTDVGITFFTDINVTMIGPPHCDVRDLIQRAIQVAQYRLNYLDPDPAEAGFLPQKTQMIVAASVAEKLSAEHAHVDVQIRVQEMREEPRFLMGRMMSNRFGTLELPPLATFGGANSSVDIEGTEYFVNKFPLPALWGTDEWAGARSPLALAFLRNLLQSPCSGAQALGEPTSSNPIVGNRYNSDRYNDTSVYADPDSSSIETTDAAGTWSDTHLDAMYLTVSQSSHLTWEQPLVRMPVANHAGGTAQSSTIVALSAPMSGRYVAIDFERYGKEPELPPWKLHSIGQANLTGALLDLEQLPPRISNGGEGLIYRARATYEYLADREISRTSEVPIGRLPIVAESFAESTSNLSNVFNESLDA